MHEIAFGYAFTSCFSSRQIFVVRAALGCLLASLSCTRALYCNHERVCLLKPLLLLLVASRIQTLSVSASLLIAGRARDCALALTAATWPSRAMLSTRSSGRWSKSASFSSLLACMSMCSHSRRIESQVCMKILTCSYSAFVCSSCRWIAAVSNGRRN